MKPHRRDDGFVTAELALGLMGVALAVYFVVGVFGVILMQLRLVDAAADLAEQAARGDAAAVARIHDDLPEGAAVTRHDEGDLVIVEVAVTIRPWGRWLIAVTLNADATTRREGP